MLTEDQVHELNTEFGLGVCEEDCELGCTKPPPSTEGEVMSEPIVNLMSDIKEWSYSRELDQSSEHDKSYIRTLQLYGEFEEIWSLKLEKQNFQCFIKCGTNSYVKAAEVIGYLEQNEAMEDYGLPAYASLELTVSEEEFNDLKDCLIQSMVNENALVNIRMLMQGLQQKPDKKRGRYRYPNKCVRIAGRPLEITSFNWVLQYREYSKVAITEGMRHKKTGQR